MLIDYKQIAVENNVQSVAELHQLFWNVITDEWTEIYCNSFPKHGEITLQRFWDFAFVVDHIWEEAAAGDIGGELPETRVVAFFGISNTKATPQNRVIMRRWGLSMRARFGSNYDKGHFMAHGFGGPIDVNLFPQLREINRGWSAAGKRYRAMEKYVSSHPGTLVFSFPHYKDLTCRPSALEYGYFDQDLNLVYEVFPNM